MCDFLSLTPQEKEKIVAKLKEKTDKNGLGGCWLWTGGTFQSSGYGNISVRRKPALAHRIAWMMHFNNPIPNGLYCCHTCDVKKCVNPHHIFIGNPKTNTMDSVRKDRRKKIKLHDRLEIARLVYEEGKTAWGLAPLYGIGKSTISRILNSKEVVEKYGKICLLDRRPKIKGKMWEKTVQLHQPLNRLSATPQPLQNSTFTLTGRFA